MRSRNSVIGSVAAVVVVAAAIGLLFLVQAVAGPALELPDEVDGYVAADTAAAYPGDERPGQDEFLAKRAAADDVNAEGWSDAFDGAAVDTRAYLDGEGESPDVVSVVAVAADAGPLVPGEGFVDAEELGLALPMTERITDGDVECLLTRSNPPRAGTDYQPDQATPDAHVCQRRRGSLTVRVTSPSGDTDAVVALVESLWDELD